MRFTFSVFSLLMLLGLQACKNDTAKQQEAAAAAKQAESGQTDTIPPANTSDVMTILSAEEFEQYIKNNPNTPLIDLRPAEEYNKAHIAGAINIPFVLEGFEAKIKHLQGATEVAVYCSNGIRSKRAAVALEKLQVKKVHLMDKGLYTWIVAHKMQVAGKDNKK
jgi:rhodanese-related sulfurtransferase